MDNNIKGVKNLAGDETLNSEITLPTPEELKALREPKYIINPRDVLPNEEIRVRQWAGEIMRKNENRLDPRTKDRHIVWSGTVKPEDIDIRQIYPFEDLNWLIYRNGIYWSLMLRSKAKLLAVMTYAKL